MGVKAKFAIASALIAASASADVALPDIFSDGMVLQRGIAVPIWGSASPGEDVEVAFAGQSKKTKAAENGAWSVKLDPMEASKTPSDLSVAGKNSIIVKNTLVGEVWLCSGQSNMEMPLKRTLGAEEEAAACSNAALRGFVMTKKWSLTPERAIKGKWQEASPQSCPSWPAVAYYYGKRLNKELDVPVGLLFCCWSGTTAQAWTPLEKLASVPELSHYLKDYKESCEKAKTPQEAKAKDDPKRNASLAAEASKRCVDPGNMGERLGWQKPGESTCDWTETQVPSGWFEDCNICGSVWYRKDVEIPEPWAKGSLTLNLDVLDDFDESYFNGVKVGATGKETDSWWLTPRHYKIPPGLAKPGKNLIAVRVFNEYGGGGFTGEADAMSIENETGETVKIAGQWMRKTELAIKTFPPVKPQLCNTPSALYNSMLAPLTPYAIKGAIWYQGESNAGAAYEYRALLPTLISSWRDAWGQGEFPFHIVQLANFMSRKDKPGQSAMAELREAQAMTAQALPRASLTVTIDLGEEQDIHYRNKRDVGERLALNALALDYGRKIEHSGPIFKSMERRGDKLLVEFEHAGKGLETKDGGPAKGFAICGSDGNFVWADAVIENGKIILSSPSVKKPLEARYAWADNPDCNLSNKDGLPAAPFRTDKFQGVTERRK